MGYRDDSALFEALTNSPLDYFVSLAVDVSSRLVHHYHLIAFQHPSCQT